MTGENLSIVLAAGGTGGHLFPAAAVASELGARGHDVHIVTDKRGMRFADIFGDRPVTSIAAGRMSEAGIASKFGAVLRLGQGYFEAQSYLRARKPGAVVGFGGYATLPILLAATSQKIASCVHEQNAVLGRVNRWLAPSVDALALTYEDTRFITAKRREKARVTGNPVREAVASLSEMAYPNLSEDGIFRILVVGGSLGARILSDVVPVALSMLPPAVRRRLQVTQQCRAEDIERSRATYEKAEIAHEVAEFLEDMPERLSWAHLVIGRAGASTLAEVAVAGRPAILVPLPIATDDHQTYNARFFEEAGAGWLVPQPDFTAADLAKRVQKLLNRPQTLVDAAAKARTLGRPDATRLLSDLIERLARGGARGFNVKDDPLTAENKASDGNLMMRGAA